MLLRVVRIAAIAPGCKPGVLRTTGVRVPYGPLMIITAKKEVLQIGSRFLAEIKYENMTFRNDQNALFRCPYRAIATLTQLMIKYLDRED